MYSPSSDIVAGKTASQIESAKRRAVKGGSKKRCRKGKSCGATCIHFGNVCMVDLPWVFSDGLTRASKEIRNTKPTTLNRIEDFINRLQEAYEKLSNLRDQNHPDAEFAWRSEPIKAEIDKARMDAIDFARKLGDGGDKAIKRIDEVAKVWELRSLPKSEVQYRAVSSMLEYGTSKKLGLTEKLPELRENLERIYGVTKDPSLKQYIRRFLGILTEEIQVLKVGSLNETKAAGRKFMVNYNEKLRSAISREDRASTVIRILRNRIDTRNPESSNLSVKERIRIKKVIFRLGTREIEARKRLDKLMEEIRNEMLRTGLSDAKVKEIVGMIKYRDVNGNSDLSNPVVKVLRGQVEEFVRMFNGRGVLETYDGKAGIGGNVVRDIEVKAVRAYASSLNKFISTDGRKGTLFHELGHFVEFQSNWVASYASQWRDSKAYSQSQIKRLKKTDPTLRFIVEEGKAIPSTLYTNVKGKDVPLFKLQDMPPLRNSNYGPGEVAVVDRFYHPYMGKVYPSGGATEVISMGLESFSNTSSMISLYRNHPDLFTFAAGLAVTPSL